MARIHSRNAMRTSPGWVMMIFGFILQIVESQLDPNLLTNGDFSMSNLSGSQYKYFTGSMPGWNCTPECEVDDCHRMNQQYESVGSYNANCTGNAVDLISVHPYNLTQNVNLASDSYLLSLNYYYPRIYANRKTLQIFFNEILIFSITPNVSFLYVTHYFEKQVQGVSGVNSLRLTVERNSGSDAFGFFVDNLSLVRRYRSFKQFVNNTILNEVSVFMTQIPGSRVLFGDIMTCFINFDRLQFYFFHKRNYSEYSTILLEKINILNSFKGLLPSNIYQLLDRNLTNRIEDYFFSIDYKYSYSSNITLTRNPNNGDGFVRNCYNFFVYTTPGVIIIFLLFVVLFRISRKRPASRLVRKYSFFGLLILMLFEGNIESLTYYAFGEFRLLFSARFQHKLINVFIVYFQWVITFIAVGSILYFQHHYGKRIRYFLENKKANSLGVLCQIVENGIICLAFGITHQLMHEQPKLQLLTLFVLQGAWMSFKVCLIFQKVYEKKIPQFIMFCSSLVRMCFILTFHFYQQEVKMRNFINYSIHMVLVAITLLLWLKELTISLLQLAYFYYKFCKKLQNFKQKVSAKLVDAQFTKITDEIRLMRKNKDIYKNKLNGMKRRPIQHLNYIGKFNRIQAIRKPSASNTPVAKIVY